MNNKFIPVNIPKLYSSEKTNVINCVRTNWISSEGKFVKEFEKKFSQYNSRKFGVAVSSGTAALEVAIKSLNLKKKFRSYYSIFLNYRYCSLCGKVRS